MGGEPPESATGDRGQEEMSPRVRWRVRGNPDGRTAGPCRGMAGDACSSGTSRDARNGSVGSDGQEAGQYFDRDRERIHPGRVHVSPQPSRRADGVALEFSAPRTTRCFFFFFFQYVPKIPSQYFGYCAWQFLICLGGLKSFCLDNVHRGQDLPPYSERSIVWSGAEVLVLSNQQGTWYVWRMTLLTRGFLWTAIRIGLV